MTGPSKSTQLRRQWKRTARHWARPYPMWMCAGATFWLPAIVCIALLLALPTVYYTYLRNADKTMRFYSGRFPMLHVLDKAVTPSVHHAMEFPSNGISSEQETAQVNPTPASAASDTARDAETASESASNTSTNTPMTNERIPLDETSSTEEPASATPENTNHEMHAADASQVVPPKTSKAWQDEAVASTSNPPKACLALIMKNEGPILPRLFESIQGFANAYCVVDTGSTDDTIDVLRSIDMPGMLVEEPFVDFATTRNFLLDTCRQRTTCEYLLLLDADMRLRVSPEWDWAKLDDQDVYDFVQVSGLEYANVRMVKRSADKVKVVGATHEYYDVPSEYSHKLLPKDLIHIDDVGDGKAKGDKFERDERLLKRELEKDPDNVRTVFYLANTLKDQGKYQEAIPYYERRATMGGWYAEADYSWFQLSLCYLALNNFEKGREYAMRAAYHGWHKRAEPLYFLAFDLHKRGEYELAWHYATMAAQIPKPAVSTVLFISYTIYDYWIAYEQASLCRHVFSSEPRFCLEKAMAFQNNVHVPDDLIEYHYPDMKEIAQPLLGEAKADLLHQSHASHGEGAMRLTSTGAIELLRPDENSNITSFSPYRRLLLEAGGDLAEENTHAEAVEIAIPDGLGGVVDVKAVGRHKLMGHSADGKTMIMGEWPDSDSITPIETKSYLIDAADYAQAPWALFETPDGTTHCITRWFPTLDVGNLKTDEERGLLRCDHVKSISQVPRSFSFFRAAAPGIVHHDNEIWLLVQSRRADANMLSIVILGSELELRAYTLPFTLKGWGQDREDPGTIQVGIRAVDHKHEYLVVAYATLASENEAGNRMYRVEQVPLTEVWRLLTTTNN